MKIALGTIFHRLDRFFFGLRPNKTMVWLSKICGRVVVWSIKQ